MTTAGNAPAAPTLRGRLETAAQRRTPSAWIQAFTDRGRLAMEPQGKRPIQGLTSVLALAAVLLGCQGLAASTPFPGDVRLLLPSEGPIAAVGDGLRRGFDLALEESRTCGQRPPSTQLAWVNPQQGLGAFNPGHLARPSLLIAPPAAPLEAYGRLAAAQRLTVLLPLQRGTSLEQLPLLSGADHLWPVVPAQALMMDRLAQGLVKRQLGGVMVVRDPSDGARMLAERFSAELVRAGGRVMGVGQEPEAIDARDGVALQQLRDDVAWYQPQTLVVITRPGSPLAQAIARGPWPSGLTLAWPFSPTPAAIATATTATTQIGVDPQGRGQGWKHFNGRFQQRWGYTPGAVEAAGYDSGLITALAALPPRGHPPGWDLLWFRPEAPALALCPALQRRQLGRAVRPLGASSAMDMAAGSPPTAQLRLLSLTATRP